MAVEAPRCQIVLIGWLAHWVAGWLLSYAFFRQQVCTWNLRYAHYCFQSSAACWYFL